MSGPPCQGVVFDVLFSLRNGVNSAGARAAGAYVETQLAPIKTEMKKQVEGIPVVIVVLLFFLVIVPLLVYLIWIAYELSVPVELALALVLVFLVFVAIAVLFCVSSIGTAINTVIEKATSQFIKLDNPQALSALKASLNNSARQYLATLGKDCVL